MLRLAAASRGFGQALQPRALAWHQPDDVGTAARCRGRPCRQPYDTSRRRCLRPGRSCLWHRLHRGAAAGLQACLSGRHVQRARGGDAGREQEACAPWRGIRRLVLGPAAGGESLSRGARWRQWGQRRARGRRLPTEHAPQSTTQPSPHDLDPRHTDNPTSPVVHTALEPLTAHQSLSGDGTLRRSNAITAARRRPDTPGLDTAPCRGPRTCAE